jgi:hypothetical protein
MDEDKAPVSIATRMEFERMLGSEQKYRMVRAARVVLRIMAALVVVFGLIELFLTPHSPTSSSTVYAKLSAMQVALRLFDLAVRAFVLLLGAQLLDLWLDLITEVRGLAERVGQRR